MRRGWILVAVENNSLGFQPRLSNEGNPRIDNPGVFDLYVPSSFTEPQRTHSLHSTDLAFVECKHLSIQQGTTNRTTNGIMT